MPRRTLLNVRTDPDTRAALQAIAHAEGITLSDVCRRAFQREIARFERARKDKP